MKLRLSDTFAMGQFKVQRDYTGRLALFLVLDNAGVKYHIKFLEN